MEASRHRRATLALVLGALLPLALQAQPAPAEIGVVVMHGKGGSTRTVLSLANVLQSRGYQVESLEMPWALRRDYDVDLPAGVAEVTRALDGMRGKGAKKVFVAGHSQGGVFAVLYGGQVKVDGIVAIAPGGQVDTGSYRRELGEHVAKARQMVAEGRGAEKAAFGDYEGRKGVSTVRTTAASYLSWFDPAGLHTTAAFGKVKEGTPVLYVAPTHDYPALSRARDAHFAAIPKAPGTRLLEVDADHMGSPGTAAAAIADWIQSVGAP